MEDDKMNIFLYFLMLFFLKVLDNALSTAKTIFVQNNRSLLASIALALSSFIYMYITKDIVMSNNLTSMVVVSIASGVGCWMAIAVNNKFSKDRTYVNVIMSDDFEEMKKLRGFLAKHKITNVVNVSYTLDWEKTLAITAYAETKEQSRLIDEYLNSSDTKFKRMVQGERVKK
jgi:uncharacterized protein YebE (UPF0316 family)